ncbi:MAG TPA: hypothetical protein VIM41_03090 [Gammaproteobacteria bacterium]
MSIRSAISSGLPEPQSTRSTLGGALPASAAAELLRRWMRGSAAPATAGAANT